MDFSLEGWVVGRGVGFIYDVSTRSYETQKEGNHLREKKAKRGR